MSIGHSATTGRTGSHGCRSAAALGWDIYAAEGLEAIQARRLTRDSVFEVVKLGEDQPIRLRGIFTVLADEIVVTTLSWAKSRETRRRYRVPADIPQATWRQPLD